MMIVASALDVELLGVKGCVALDQDVFGGELLEFHEPAGVVLLEDLDGFGMDAEQHVSAFKVALHFAELRVNLIADRGGTLDHAGGLAGVAGNREGALEGLLDALAGDGDQTKIVELQNLGWGAIGLEGFFKGGENPVAILALVHIDEVDDDDAAEVAEANLANDLGDRIEIGFDDGVFKARRLADIFAGVDVDGDEGFGLIDDDGAAALEPDFGAKGFRRFRPECRNARTAAPAWCRA